jgi:HAD superfamily hydrolase (TIGR01490 family)
MAQEQKVAVFDIDGTIFRSSLLIELVEVFIEEGIFESQVRGIYQRAQQKWVDRKGSYEEYIMAVVAAFTSHIKGVHYSDFDRAAKIVIARNKDRLYRYTRDLTQKLKKKGYYLLAISHSPKGIVDPFAKRLGFDKVYGMFYELGPTDKFNGKIADEHLIRNKANILRRAVAKENLTLKGSIGVGDTEGDIPVFELVETPICFNPNMTLYRHAKRNKWKIVVERKDVIYELN